MMRISRLPCVALLAGPVLVSVPTAHAVVNTIDASVTAEVKEFVGDTLLNSDLAFEDLGETTGNLPLEVTAELFRTEGDEQVAGAAANTTFFDPRLAEDPDPDEFGIDLAAFSRKSEIAYEGTSSATEIREVVFTADDIGSPAGTALEARSQFFLDGYLLLWTEGQQTDLSGTTAEVSLSVQQDRPAEAGPTTVLTASLTLTGNADGTVSLSTGGSLVSDNVVVTNLTGQMEGFGPTHLVVIPNLAIPYLYSARVDETFELRADISARIRNRPGTGASVLLGVPILELAAVINALTGASLGDQFGQFVQNALTSSPPPAKPLPSSSGPSVKVVNEAQTLLDLPAALCGMLGVESALLLAVFGAAAAAVTSRRRR